MFVFVFNQGFNRTGSPLSRESFVEAPFFMSLEYSPCGTRRLLRWQTPRDCCCYHLLGAVKGPTFDQEGPSFPLCHSTQRQNWKVLHAQKRRSALRAPRLFCGRWTFQFCLCVPWHRRKVGPFWSKVGPLTAASTSPFACWFFPSGGVELARA